MKRTALLLAVLMLGISTLAFGWGNATHVYLANRLGAKLGPVNLQEMYGALTPDVFNFMFDANGQILSNLTHFQPGLIYAAATTAEEKAIAYGFMTHNNAFGADLTAHGSPDFPNPLWPASKPGWVIKYGNVAGANLIAPLKVILANAGVPDGYLEPIAAYLAPTMGHDLVETAVDILIKRYQDPLVGLRMAIAARSRTPQTGNLLVKAFAPALVAYTAGDPTIDDVTPGQAEALILGAEAMYQPAMEQYGQAFLLPEKMLIQALSEQSAVVAKQLIEAVLTSETGMTGWDVSVPPSLVSENIVKSIALVKNVYAQEIAKTYEFVSKQLFLNHITTPPFCAMLGKENDPAAEQIGQEEQLAAPASFGLEQNYPNPFNPSTEIRYQLAAPGQVSLKIFNMIGQEVAVLVNDVQQAGSHQVRWDAGALPSGNYFYRLDAGGAVSTKRMTLVK
jgi:hypothetical protein